MNNFLDLFLKSIYVNVKYNWSIDYNKSSN